MTLACQLPSVANLVKPNCGLGIGYVPGKQTKPQLLQRKYRMGPVPSRCSGCRRRFRTLVGRPPELGIDAGLVDRTDGQALLCRISPSVISGMFPDSAMSPGGLLQQRSVGTMDKQ